MVHGGIALNAVNWTRLPQGNDATCLAKEHTAVERQCTGVHIALVSKRDGACLVTQRLLPFQTPRPATHKAPSTCVSAGKEPDNVTMSRYLLNHGHQAEIMLPMLDDAVRAGEAPNVVHWYWRRTHWVSELMRVMLPFTRVVASRAKPSHACRTYHPIGSGGGGRHWLRAARTADLMRAAMRRHCGLRERPVALDAASGRERARVVVLLRGDSQQPNATAGDAPPSAERRAFADPTAVLRTLRAALPGASVRVATSTGDAPICAQARWVHGASVLVSPHGAHLTNALWMRRGSVLVEVMPWGMWRYEGYVGLFHAGGIAHARIRAARPPADAPHWLRPDAAAAVTSSNASSSAAAQEYDEGRCARTQECRLFYRSRSALHFGTDELCRALRKHVPAARQAGSVCHLST